LLGAGLAAQKFGTKIEEEQEILSNLADMVGEVYNMESAILRTDKAIQKSHEEKESLKKLYTEVYVQEAFTRIESKAKEILGTIEEGDELRMMLSSLRRLCRYNPKNVVAMKRDIADRIIKEEKYVV